jgi:endonuclease III
MKRELEIVAMLVKLAEEWRTPEGIPVDFEVRGEANDLLNDLEHHPHAFFLGCMANFMVKTERAWLVPFEICRRFGDFSMALLATRSEEDLETVLTEPSQLIPFPKVVAGRFARAIDRICNVHQGDVSRIWLDSPPSGEVVYRLLWFDGVGQKIAAMTTNMLAYNFRIPFSDFSAIDMAADIHVKRVFPRLGLVGVGASPEQVIFKARTHHPEYPGILDFPTWKIGREWCHVKKANCSGCPMGELCPQVGVAV